MYFMISNILTMFILP